MSNKDLMENVQCPGSILARVLQNQVADQMKPTVLRVANRNYETYCTSAHRCVNTYQRPHDTTILPSWTAAAEILEDSK